MDEAVSTAAKKKPPWPHTAGKTWVPSFAFVLVSSKLVPRSLPGSLSVCRRWRFQDKSRVLQPFFPPSSSSVFPDPIPSSMARSIFDRPPTPYPAQPHPQPLTRVSLVSVLSLDRCPGIVTDNNLHPCASGHYDRVDTHAS
jgi:hypothetical protein